jgi:hypothetical protein
LAGGGKGYMLEMLYNYERADGMLPQYRGKVLSFIGSPSSGKFSIITLKIIFIIMATLSSLDVTHCKTISIYQRILFYVNKFHKMSPHRDWNPRPHACGVYALDKELSGQLTAVYSKPLQVNTSK